MRRSVRRSTAGSRHRNRILIMGVGNSRKRKPNLVLVLAGCNKPMNFIAPEHLRRAVEVGRGCSSASCLPDRPPNDDELLVECAATIAAESGTDLFDSVQACSHAVRDYDPHDEFLGSIGALKRGRR